MGKKNFLTLLLILALLSPLMVGNGYVAAKNGEVASTTPIRLGLGDSIIFGNYTVQFYDVNSNWSVATILLEANNTTRLYFLKEGQVAYYPSRSVYALAVKLVGMSSSSSSVYVSLESPLRLFREGLTMTPNRTVVINSLTSIKLDGLFTNGASFTVRAGSLTKLNLASGTTVSLNCTLPSGVTYSHYLAVHLNSVSNGVATLDLYLPAVVPIPFSIRRTSTANGTRPKGSKLIPYVPVYGGYVYPGDNLTVRYNGSMYEVEVLNVSSADVLLKALWKGKSENIQISVGTGVVRLGRLPLMIELSGVDVTHSRAYITVLAPEGASATPPFHPANITVSISASPKSMLLGQKLVVVINVRNNGPGDVRDLSVAAPVPSGFRLISSSKVWMMNVLPAFSSMPALVYVLEPTSVGNFSIGQATVVYTSNGTKTIKSRLLGGISVYAIPRLVVKATTEGKVIKMNGSGGFPLTLNVSALGTNPRYEFVNDAKVTFQYPNGVSGPAYVSIGRITAGTSVRKSVTVRISGKGLYGIKAYLTYRDPLGDQHTVNLGYVATVDSIPPKVIVRTKVVRVYPKGQQLVSYINETLKSGNPTSLATEIDNVIKPYLPKGVNYWIPVSVVFIVLTAVFVYETARYRAETERLRRKVERRRKPGGLPKKEEAIEGIPGQGQQEFKTKTTREPEGGGEGKTGIMQGEENKGRNEEQS